MWCFFLLLIAHFCLEKLLSIPIRGLKKTAPDGTNIQTDGQVTDMTTL